MVSRARNWLARLGLAVAGAGLLCAGCGGDRAPAGARTVVLVTVDTLRRDHVGAFASPGTPSPARTPRMDALAAEGLRFLDARTPVPLTLPAHVTMLSGRPPAAHGVRSNSASRVPPPERRAWRLVAETLASRGRCCGAFVSAGPLVAQYGLSSGFMTYDDVGLDDRTRGLYAERPGTETVARALAWLRGLPREAPVFLWVHLFEPHEPHARDYRTDVEAADAAVGALLDGLTEVGRGDAAVVLAADHGEALGELGEGSHGFLLGESVLRVPLVVRAPGRGRGARYDPADLSDVAPTLLSLAGAPPAQTSGEVGFGRDLLAGAAPADRPRVAEGLHAWHQHRWAQLSCAVVGPVKLEDRGPGGVLLLQLDPLAPPGQEPGVPAAGRPEAEVLAAALRAYRRSEDRTPSPGGAAPGGYGAGGAVGTFLEPEENAKHPDPYARIEDVRRINEAAAWILSLPPIPERLREALARLERVALGDPTNPAIPFWRGRALRVLARHREAREAFARALELGREDAETLLLALRSAIAEGAPAEGAKLLERFGARVPVDARVTEAEAETWTALGQPERAQAARRRAPPATSAAPAPVPNGCR